jgi:hypothetical protein
MNNNSNNNINEIIKERYGEIDMVGNSNSCCRPNSECYGSEENSIASTILSAETIG